MPICLQKLVHARVYVGAAGPAVFEVRLVRDRDGERRHVCRQLCGPPAELASHVSSGPRSTRIALRSGPASVALAVTLEHDAGAGGGRLEYLRIVPEGEAVLDAASGALEVVGELRGGVRVAALFASSALVALLALGQPANCAVHIAPRPGRPAATVLVRNCRRLPPGWDPALVRPVGALAGRMPVLTRTARGGLAEIPRPGGARDAGDDAPSDGPDGAPSDGSGSDSDGGSRPGRRRSGWRPGADLAAALSAALDGTRIGGRSIRVGGPMTDSMLLDLVNGGTGIPLGTARDSGKGDKSGGKDGGKGGATAADSAPRPGQSPPPVRAEPGARVELVPARAEPGPAVPGLGEAGFLVKQGGQEYGEVYPGRVVGRGEVTLQRYEPHLVLRPAGARIGARVGLDSVGVAAYGDLLAELPARPRDWPPLVDTVLVESPAFIRYNYQSDFDGAPARSHELGGAVTFETQDETFRFLGVCRGHGICCPLLPATRPPCGPGAPTPLLRSPAVRWDEAADVYMAGRAFVCARSRGLVHKVRALLGDAAVDCRRREVGIGDLRPGGARFLLRSQDAAAVATGAASAAGPRPAGIRLACDEPVAVDYFPHQRLVLPGATAVPGAAAAAPGVAPPEPDSIPGTADARSVVLFRLRADGSIVPDAPRSPGVVGAAEALAATFAVVRPAGGRAEIPALRLAVTAARAPPDAPPAPLLVAYGGRADPSRPADPDRRRYLRLCLAPGGARLDLAAPSADGRARAALLIDSWEGLARLALGSAQTGGGVGAAPPPVHLPPPQAAAGVCAEPGAAAGLEGLAPGRLLVQARPGLLVSFEERAEPEAESTASSTEWDAAEAPSGKRRATGDAKRQPDNA
jgi:hypothetical protein